MKRDVVIFGGTHGNERTGVELVRYWSSQPQVVERDHLCTLLISSNPRAIALNRRYVDHDLNRSFLAADLKKPGNSDTTRSLYEFDRARELAQQLGDSVDLSQSFLIDLHTTTSAMGPTVIITTDHWQNFWVAAYVQARLPQLRVITNIQEREASPFVNALSPFGFCVEVGPVAQGCLRHSVLDLCSKITQLSLDALELLQVSEERVPQVGLPQSIETFSYFMPVDYPRDEHGQLLAYVHPEREGNDFLAIENGSLLFLGFDRQEFRLEGLKAGEFVWPIFVGEAAYVEKSVAMVLTKRNDTPL